MNVGVMLRYLKLFWALFRYSAIREMMFKANFLLWVVVEFAWFGLQLVLIEVIYLHVQEVAGWNKYEMILLIGTSHVVQQLFQLIFMINLIEFPENVRTGRLDFALLQPADSQFMASIRKFDPGSIVNISVALGIVGYAVWKLNLHPSLMHLSLYTLLVINGALIHYALMLAIVTLSFWIVRAQGLVYGYYNLFQIARIPRQAFTGGVRFFFTWVLPMLIVANAPAESLVRSNFNGQILGLLAITACSVTVSSLWFRFGLKSYTSASS